MLDKRTPQPDKPVVYTIQAEAGGPVKIGYCDRGDGVDARLCGIQTGNPERLVIRRVIAAPNGRADERALHDRLAKYRMCGEWFTCSPEVAMATGAPLPGKYDLERYLLPIVENAFAAGKRAGEREAEQASRDLLRVYFEGFIRLMEDEETDQALDPDDDIAALLVRSAAGLAPKLATPLAG